MSFGFGFRRRITTTAAAAMGLQQKQEQPVHQKTSPADPITHFLPPPLLLLLPLSVCHDR
jgi:hypothetical protein